MILQYRPAAIEDVQNASGYIRDTLSNPPAAKKLTEKIVQGIALLKENPYMGASLSSRIEGAPESIRFLIISRQLVFYEVHEEHIEIIRVLDSRTDYLTTLFS